MYWDNGKMETIILYRDDIGVYIGFLSLKGPMLRGT